MGGFGVGDSWNGLVGRWWLVEKLGVPMIGICWIMDLNDNE
jgi:hypothetical protein